MSNRKSKEQMLHELLPKLRELRSAARRFIQCKSAGSKIFHAELVTNSMATIKNVVDWHLVLTEFENFGKTDHERAVLNKLSKLDRIFSEALEFVGSLKGESVKLVKPYAEEMIKVIDFLESANARNAISSESRMHHAHM